MFIENLGADGYIQNDVITAGAGAVAAHAVNATLGFEMLLVTIIDQGIQAFDRLDQDMTATTAIAAVRAAIFDVFLTPEADAAVTACTGLDVYFTLIEKFHYLPQKVYWPKRLYLTHCTY